MDGHLPITVLACVLSNSTLSDSWHSDKSTRCWRWNLCPQINPHRNTPGVIKKVRHLRSTSLPAVLSSPSLFLHHISSYMWLVIRNHVIRALRFNTHGFSSRVRWGSTLLHSNIFSRKFIFTAPSPVNWRTACPWLESCYKFTIKQRRVFGGAGSWLSWSWHYRTTLELAALQSDFHRKTQVRPLWLSMKLTWTAARAFIDLGGRRSRTSFTVSLLQCYCMWFTFLSSIIFSSL